MQIKQKGTALITALFIMAIVAIAATAMSERLQIAIQRTTLTNRVERLYLIAQASDFWAMGVLYKNLQKNKQRYLKKEAIDQMPIGFEKNKDGDAIVSARLTDAQAKFNLNNLSNPDFIKPFTRLIHYVDPKTSENQAEKIAEATANWVNKTPNSVADIYYLQMKPPYRAAHQLMADKSELRLVQGVSQSLYLKLKPYIVALPETTPININTATKPIYVSLGINVALLDQLLQYRRQKKSFKTINDFLTEINKLQKNLPEKQKLKLKQKELTVISQFFLCQIQVKIDKQQLNLLTLIERKISGKRVSISILQQDRNWF